MPSTTSAIRRGLAELAKHSSARTLMDEVVDALPDIEKAIASGVTYAQICETFNANGVPLNVMALRQYLYRLRKAGKSSPAATAPAKKAAAKAAAKSPTRSAKR